MDATTSTADAIPDFSSDPRIHFNTVSKKWEFEDDDGNEMQWDEGKHAWVPIVSPLTIICPCSRLMISPFVHLGR
jgi:hypothetical protein